MCRLATQNLPAQYVFRLANALRMPAPAKKLVTTGKANPSTAVEQLSHCSPQPCKSMKKGMTTQKEYMPAFKRSCGRRSPRTKIHFRTVLSENHPPRSVPKRKPAAGAMQKRPVDSEDVRPNRMLRTCLGLVRSEYCVQLRKPQLKCWKVTISHALSKSELPHDLRLKRCLDTSSA